MCFPLVYTQVATLVTYTFLLMCIIGRQYITPANNLNPEYACDLYFPIFTVMQVVFYVGWFKVSVTVNVDLQN